MARNNNLAGLAALGALGYMLTRDKGQAADQTPGLGRQSLGAGYDSPGTNTGSATDLKTPMQSIADADKSDRSSSLSMKGESGVTTPGTDTSTPNLNTEVNKPRSKTGKSSFATNKTANAYASGVMGGGRQPDAEVKKNTATPIVSKTSGVSTPNVGRDVWAAEEKKPLDLQSNMPDKNTNFKAYQNELNRRITSNLRKGGAVKMASGGSVSSASRRADGIATKGKTRGKIC
jgi:hypothetical protein